MTATTTEHPFEASGLGQAPFRFDGYTESKFQAAPGEPIRAGSSCDHCGTAIMGVFWVKSADGKRFKVGCSCIQKVYREVDTEIPFDIRAAIAKVERDKREAKREAAWSKMVARIASARAALESAPALFTDKPHPHAGLASSGKTLRDYYVWMLAHGGTAGRSDACRAIETALSR